MSSQKKKATRKPGRPATGHDKARQFGRVADQPWRRITRAAKKAGKTRTQFMLDACLLAADEVLGSN